MSDQPGHAPSAAAPPMGESPVGTSLAPREPAEPVGAEPVGAEPVGAEPVGAEPVGEGRWGRGRWGRGEVESRARTRRSPRRARRRWKPSRSARTRTRPPPVPPHPLRLRHRLGALRCSRSRRAPPGRAGATGRSGPRRPHTGARRDGSPAGPPAGGHYVLSGHGSPLADARGRERWLRCVSAGGLGSAGTARDEQDASDDRGESCRGEHERAWMPGPGVEGHRREPDHGRRRAAQAQRLAA